MRKGIRTEKKAEIIRAKGKNSSPKELEKLQQLQEAIEDINNQRDALQLERKKKVKDLSPEEYQNWQTNIDKPFPKRGVGDQAKASKKASRSGNSKTLTEITLRRASAYGYRLKHQYNRFARRCKRKDDNYNGNNS